MKTRISRAVALVALIVIVRIGVAQCHGWSAMDAPGPWSPSVMALTTWDPDGPGASPEALVAGGYFDTIGGIPINGIATWDGISWQPLGSGFGTVNALCVYNGELIAGGDFSSAIARWDGASWTPLGGGVGGGVGVPNVDALIVYNGELVAGGSFTMAGGIAAAHVARWNGSVWQPLGAGTNSSLRALAVWNGDLIAGGIFSQAGGTAASRVARWDGSSWFPLGAGLSNQGVYALTVHDGELYAGGTFYEGAGNYFMARWNGAIWQPIDGPSSTVLSFGEYEGDLVAGGMFTFVSGVACNCIARWNGSTWQAFGLGLVVNGSVVQAVFSLASYGGALIAGGRAFELPDTPPNAYNGIAQWSTPFSVHVAQPGGAGSGVFVTNTGLTPGHEYFNIASYEICAGGPGSGPYGGLCFSDLSFLYFQLSFPAGFHPFHFIAGGPTLVVGPYYSNPGSYDAICADVTVPSLDCISPVTRFTLQ